MSKAETRRVKFLAAERCAKLYLNLLQALDKILRQSLRWRQLVLCSRSEDLEISASAAAQHGESPTEQIGGTRWGQCVCSDFTSDPARLAVSEFPSIRGRECSICSDNIASADGHRNLALCTAGSQPCQCQPGQTTGACLQLSVCFPLVVVVTYRMSG